MAESDRYAAIAAEQDAFDRQLESMLQDHAGQFVVFNQQRPAGFYPSYREAYEAALRTLGPDEVFLVAEVRRRRIEPVSLSWVAGVMFGDS